MLDIVVIGGGPVGSRVAYKMAQMGHSVTVLEKRDTIGAKPCCTGIISQECIRNFSIPQEVVYKECNSARIFSPSGNCIRVNRPEIQASIVSRKAFDSAIADLAQSSGAVYNLNSKVENIIFQPDKVRVNFTAHGKNQSLDTRVVVLASGFSSPLVRNLGLGQPGYFVAGAQTEVEGSGIEEVEIYLDQTLSPGFFAWLVPTAEGRVLVGLLTRQSPGHRLKQFLSILESQNKIVTGKYAIRYGGIPLKPLKKTYGQRMIVVGDAAGQVKPTTGGGLYFGMICADIAADTLHNALLNDDFSAKKLSGYQSSWQSKLGKELKREYFARRFYERLNNKQIDSLFSRVKTSGIVDSLLQDESFSFDWHGGLMLKVLKYNLKRLIIKDR